MEFDNNALSKGLTPVTYDEFKAFVLSKMQDGAEVTEDYLETRYKDYLHYGMGVIGGTVRNGPHCYYDAELEEVNAHKYHHLMRGYYSRLTANGLKGV